MENYFQCICPLGWAWNRFLPPVPSLPMFYFGAQQQDLQGVCKELSALAPGWWQTLLPGGIGAGLSLG